MAFYLLSAKSSVQSVRPWKFIRPKRSYSISSSVATSSTLLGPPEIYLFRPKTHDIVPPPPSPSHSNPFVDAMVSSFNSTTVPNPPPAMMGYTENMSPAYLTTANPCLNFFFHVVPDSPPIYLTQRLKRSWDHDPLKTLKLICNLRGVRGTGKSDKEGYYTSALWLHKNHPKTLACNVASLAKFGYFKDLPEILFRLLEGLDVREKETKEHKRKTEARLRRLKYQTKSRDNSDANKKNVPREMRIMEEMKKMEMVKSNASKLRKEKRVTMATKAIERYHSDPDYKMLHERVSDLFAERMRSDVKLLAEGRLREISFAAKWCPSVNSAYDKSTLLCESIAKKVFPREEYPEYEGVEEEHYAYRVRDRLRKQVLVPLRKSLELPEVYMQKNQWHLIPYNKVASLAMELYKNKFLEHDKLRFEEYLDNVSLGKAKMKAGTLLPHKIISGLNHRDGGRVAELQWKSMVDDMAKKGKLNNCLAICDVSGSMSWNKGVAIQVSVALGVLVSELSEEPWKGKLITFSEKPELQLVEGDDLRSKVKFVKNMAWDLNTDFQKVFDLILEVATNAGLTESQMIKRVFVFSDMEFDQASLNPWETDYQAIKRKFTEKGYGGAVPEIVFWNLRDSQSTPVTAQEKGVALVSGFSKNLLKLFLEEGDLNLEEDVKVDQEGEINPDEDVKEQVETKTINPEDVMEKAISGEEYEKLVVLD